MPLNDGQQKAFMDVIHFMNDDSQMFMDLTGPAGSGKTYLISQIADGILKHKKAGSPLHTVEITATTNKAAAVLSEAMPHRAGSIQTIYSFMNLRLSENFSNGTTKIVPTKTWTVHSGVFLIVDEDSMIPTDLFSYMKKGLHNTCKVLFVGDRNQLAPVKETLSPIFTQGYNTSTLSQSMRNAESEPLMALCEQAKQTVLTGVFTPIVEVPGVIDFVDGPGMKGVLERMFTKEDPTRRVLAYTNDKVIGYNQYMRFLRGYNEPFEVGEILSNNQSAELVGKERLYTDQVVRVLDILEDKEDPNIVPGHLLRTITLRVEDVQTLAQYEVTSFASPEDRKDVLKYFGNNKKFDRYFKIKNNFPDLRSVSASTTHKAQGSTYDIVVVDLENIGKCTNRDQTARMQYVALSRPRSRLIIKGKLPERYF